MKRIGDITIGFIAIVHTTDGVSFATTAGTRSALIERIADYVRRVARDRLFAGHAQQVLRLLESAQLERGIERYFSMVGKRWDEEWLVTAAIGGGAQPAARALVDCVVPERVATVAVA
jgi:hypothetical protein